MSKTYQEVFNKVHTLELEEQYQLLQELVVLLGKNISAKKQRSIMELEGLGKEIWKGIDAQQYVDKERESWNG